MACIIVAWLKGIGCGVYARNSIKTFKRLRMLRNDSVLRNVLAFVHGIEIHMEGPRLKAYKEDRAMECYNDHEQLNAQRQRAFRMVWHMETARGFSKLARVSNSFLRVLRPLLQQSKGATMHDRALLRVINARVCHEFGKHCYEIEDMASVACMISTNDDFYFPHQYSRGVIPYNLLLPKHYLGCAHILHSFLTNEEKNISSSLSVVWKVALREPHTWLQLLFPHQDGNYEGT